MDTKMISAFAVMDTEVLALKVVENLVIVKLQLLLELV